MVRYLRKVCFVATAACFLLIIAADGIAQKPRSKPDLSGTWLLDAKKSNSVGLTSRPDLPIKISHQDPELRITLTSESNGQVVERQSAYFTDGRGEENQATTMLTLNPGGPPRDPQKTKSTTRWSGNKIVTRSLLQLQAGGRVVEFELVDEWKLSSDGKTLTQTTRTVYLHSSGGAFIPAMAPDKKRVYNRV
ncbi:MAG: hypothetical protein WAM70_00745 [Pyrinomonadaceae bacterium]